MAYAYVVGLENITENNLAFRHVIFTAPSNRMQLVLMSLNPGEDIGMEIHEDTDQFFRFESGTGLAIADDKVTSIGPGDGLVITAGTNHNIINNGLTPLKFYTIYNNALHSQGEYEIQKKTE